MLVPLSAFSILYSRCQETAGLIIEAGQRVSCSLSPCGVAVMPTSQLTEVRWVESPQKTHVFVAIYRCGKRDRVSEHISDASKRAAGVLNAIRDLSPKEA